MYEMFVNKRKSHLQRDRRENWKKKIDSHFYKLRCARVCRFQSFNQTRTNGACGGHTASNCALLRPRSRTCAVEVRSQKRRWHNNLATQQQQLNKIQYRRERRMSTLSRKPMRAVINNKHEEKKITYIWNNFAFLGFRTIVWSNIFFYQSCPVAQLFANI